MQIRMLSLEDPQFPDPRHALEEPDGLLAAGGNLHPTTLLSAYRQGIFPWYQDDDPILWWSPATRCVLNPALFHCSKSLSKSLRRNDYSVTTNKAFEAVINACSDPRDLEGGTWITDEMTEAYIELHHQGVAHSLEVWRDDLLIGGLYGLAIGNLFCGESMFSRSADASKIAMAHLCRWGTEAGLELIDCQLVNPHLLSLGAEPLSRRLFLKRLRKGRDKPLNWGYLGSENSPQRLEFCW
ncbi:MAG: leucyl/phenylalanyl-tRNA--protein transferase [Porticoccaceae bacterium]|nr:leucyl/phenylalanyl-tRNA--protein transferase [Porticoccaceae bacterium]